ncbi:MAG: sialidase family protein [Bacteroidales bacterium]|nr:sialidase family protein [Bacteroidales bacterium]
MNLKFAVFSLVLMLSVCFSAQAAVYKVRQTPVSPADAIGKQVVLYNVTHNLMAGHNGSSEQAKAGKSTLSDLEKPTYTVTVTAGANGSYTLKNEQGFGPSLAVKNNGSGSVNWNRWPTAMTYANGQFYTDNKRYRAYLSHSGLNGHTTVVTTQANASTQADATKWELYEVVEAAEIESPLMGSVVMMPKGDKGDVLTTTVRVKAEGLTSGLYLSVAGDDFKLDHYTLTAEQANAGIDVKVTFSSEHFGTYAGVLTITGEDDIHTEVHLHATVISAADDRPTIHNQLYTWAADEGYQAVGYAGLGNHTEMLALAMVNNAEAGVPVMQFRLFGETAKYVRSIRFYARPRDPNSDYRNLLNGEWTNAPENTFAHIYDYRNPSRNMGAILLGFTINVPEVGRVETFTSSAKLPAGEYVIYLTADISTEEEIGGIDQLPLIAGNPANYTRVGGQIMSVSCGSQVHEINTINNYSAEGGGRVILPKYKMLFSPKDKNFPNEVDYSNFFRIPSACTTANGSIILLSDARKGHIHDVSNDIDIVARWSTDHGKTWSNYMVLFEGEHNEAAGPDGCDGCTGYGDASLAAFRDGSVVVATVYGLGLFKNDATAAPTKVVWRLSRDNGRTWGDVKEMPLSMSEYFRGNITPGLMCVGTAGVLRGHAIGCLRTSTYQNPGATQTTNEHRVYLTAFNPDENNWTNILNANGKPLYIADGTDLDESNVVELAENVFLISARSLNADHRRFFRLEVEEGAGGTIVGTVTPVTQNGISLAMGCNGGITSYQGKHDTHLFHTLPKDYISKYGSTARSSLTLYTTLKDDASHFNWKPCFAISDPFDDYTASNQEGPEGGLGETAQYSTVVEQADNTVAIFYEGYPYAIRHYDEMQEGSKYSTQHTGDWLMCQYYMNLRIGDILPDEEPLVRREIHAPWVTPRSATFNSDNPADRPEIVISHDNYETLSETYSYDDPERCKVNTYYEFSWHNDKGEVLAHSDMTVNFSEASKAFTWEEVWSTLRDINTDEPYCDSDPALGKNGYVLHVTTICLDEHDYMMRSLTTSRSFIFSNPVRRIAVVGLPTTGVADITLVSEGGMVGPHEWLTATVGKHIAISAPANYPYQFKGFYYKYSTGTLSDDGGVLLSDLIEVNRTSGINHHIVFRVPKYGDEVGTYATESDKEQNILPDNYRDDIEGFDGLIIYAVYDMSVGFSSRVNTQYNNGRSNGGSNFESQFSYWVPASADSDDELRIIEAKGGDKFPADLKIPTPLQQSNPITSGTGRGAGGALTYPQNLNYGLDAYVTLVPDAHTAENLNAIVRLKVDGVYQMGYYVVNGFSHHLTSHMLEEDEGCLGYYHWYDFYDGEIHPVAVGMKSYEVGLGSEASSAMSKAGHQDDGYVFAGGDDKAWYKVNAQLAFPGILARGEQTHAAVEVEVYLVSDNVTSVDQLSSPEYYVTKVVHTITRDDDLATGVLNAEVEKTVAKEVYYNVLGIPSARPHEGVNVKVTTYTDGTTTSTKMLK